MRCVVRRMQDTPYVLKGGTALAFAYDLDRHSTDIDFDTAEPVYIRDRVKVGLGDAGVQMADWIVSKDSGLGQRFKCHYKKWPEGEDRLLNVDISFRTVPKAEDLVVVRGIRTYRLRALFNQKLAAGEGRTAGRDLYDLAFLVARYGNRLSNEQIKRAEVFSREYDLLAAEYDPAFRDDSVLSRISTADDRALMLRIAVEEQILRRDEIAADQAVPGSESLAKALAAHGIWCETGGREGRRAVLNDLDFSDRAMCGVNLDRVILVRPNFTNTDLRNATLRDAVLRGAILDGTNLTGVDATGAELREVTFRNVLMGPTTRGIAEALASEHQRTAGFRPLPEPPLRGVVREHDHGPSR